MVELSGLLRSGARAALLVTVVLAGTSPMAPREARAADPGVCVRAAAARAQPASARYGYATTVLSGSGRTRWILGMSAGRRSPGRPLALRWSGGRWHDTAVPWRAVVSGLVDGDVVGRDVWAVGFIRPGSSLRPIVGRWSQGRWADVTVPVLPSSGASLTDVAAFDDGSVWIVGTRYDEGQARALAARRTAGGWERVDPHLGAESALLAVTKGPGGEPWAAGWAMQGGQPRPVIARWSHGGWQRMADAAQPAGAAVLTDILVRSATEAWVVGYHVAADTGRHVPLLERWDGTHWIEVSLPRRDAGSMAPRAISVGRNGGMVIAGVVIAGDRHRERGFIARSDGDGWSLSFAGRAGPRHWELMGAGVIGNGAVGVGGVGNKVVVRGACGGVTVPFRPEAWAERALGEPARSAEGVIDPEASTGTASTRGSGRADAPRRAVPVGELAFRDVARPKRVADVTSTYSGVAADFDRDGWMDLLITRHNVRPPRFLLGGRDGFHEPSGVRLGERDFHGCAAADVDADGAPDLFCAVGANHGYISKSNTLWLHPGVGTPVPAAASFGLVDPFGRGRRATFLDLDGDPYPDLFVTNEPERVDGLPSTNRLYRNVGGARFVAAPEVGVDHSMGGACAVAADLDGDADDDLLVCATERWAGARTGLRSFRNDGGTMVDATRALGIRPIGDVDALATDLDGDGRTDLVQLGRRTLKVSLGTPSGFRAAYSRDIEGGVAIAAGDVNADGRPDLYVALGGGGNAADLMLVNGGRGRSFTLVRVPHASWGTADDVIALDHDRNGLDDFLVLNGAESAGPIQLIAAFRRS